jgi:nitroreductase
MAFNIIETLNSRFSIKNFDATKKISDKDFDIILEVLRLTPSAFGLQPWKFLIIKNANLRKTLKEFAWHQDQVTDASHLIVLCSIKDLNQKYIDKYIALVAKERGLEISALDGYRKKAAGYLLTRTKEDLCVWAGKQVYIALGNLLTACAVLKIDACPIEGFDRQKFDEILNLDKMGLKSEVVCALGYRSENDVYSN